jgi:hypothetical protein
VIRPRSLRGKLTRLTPTIDKGNLHHAIHMSMYHSLLKIGDEGLHVNMAVDVEPVASDHATRSPIAEVGPVNYLYLYAYE